jgi:hypothetical protein
LIEQEIKQSNELINEAEANINSNDNIKKRGNLIILIEKATALNKNGT